MKRSKLERAFYTRWLQLKPEGAPEPVEQFRAFVDSRHRFDFAWPEQRLLLEMQGGTWTRGGHVRGSGYARDCFKINKAQEHGWRVLQFTTEMLRNDPAAVIDQVIRCLEQRVEVWVE